MTSLPTGSSERGDTAPTAAAAPNPGSENLVASILVGDEGAERELVRRYHRPMRALLRRRLGGADEAEDLLQEALRLGLEKIRGGQLRESSKLSSFLMSLARNLALDHVRKRVRRQTEADSEAVERRALCPPDSQERLEADERAALVRRLLDELESPRDRDILRRFYLEDEDKSTICRDMGLSSLHFNRVLHRARVRYKRIFEDEAGRPW